MISTWLSDNAQNAALALFALSAWSLIQQKRRERVSRRELPPGPSGLPFFGNALQIRDGEPWKTYTEWATVYGDLVYVKLFKQGMIIINSEETAKELLEHRSQNYSDRAVSAITEPVGLGFSTVRLPYGQRWRLHRKLYHQVMRADAATSYHPMQLAKARRLLAELLETPSRYHLSLQKFSASIALSIAYDWDVAEKDDPLVSRIESTMDLVFKTLSPMNSVLLSAFPFLLYLPKWMPGSCLRRNIEICREYIKKMADEPFQYVLESLESGKVGKSLASDSLRKLGIHNADPELVLAIKQSSATAFGAGSETTTSSMLVFMLAMVLNPRVQERAQKEIDAMIGTTRLPNFNDRPSLPYVEAVLRETLRWHPVAPLSIPHAAVNNDIYRSYSIPKGMIFVPNAWAMSRNEKKYPRPSEFMPERFISAHGKLTSDTVNFAWGFGRRICAGRHVADASLWAAMVSILATFKLLPAQGPDGESIEIEPRWTNGLTSHPAPFPCRIVARTPEMNPETLAQLIQSSVAGEV
ncbi:hypothetical protein HYDPIDRAFT_89513 [Hydnomerulius pinastri MD-312]|uniref:Cytochrome P450 n=1 Tax=Hydnomerulius pinastri MD-312 TaxID=994086 RepID=A0A0C9WG64_9AGAM|nr:hypothetical protein HYDPIDRAFT_89513 [Hydnomerulius pinastri MD-312]